VLAFDHDPNRATHDLITTIIGCFAGAVASANETSKCDPQTHSLKDVVL
jgi:hypothetical protein